jgi:hypothetical protein
VLFLHFIFSENISPALAGINDAGGEKTVSSIGRRGEAGL